MNRTTDYQPGKPERTWFPLDANFTRDQTVRDAGEPAAWLFLAILGHIKLTGRRGGITRDEIARLDVPHHASRLETLIAAGLLNVAPGNDEVVRVTAWEDWQGNPQRAAYMRERRARVVAEATPPPIPVQSGRNDEYDDQSDDDYLAFAIAWDEALTDEQRAIRDAMTCEVIRSGIEANCRILERASVYPNSAALAQAFGQASDALMDWFIDMLQRAGVLPPSLPMVENEARTTT